MNTYQCVLTLMVIGILIAGLSGCIQERNDTKRVSISEIRTDSTRYLNASVSVKAYYDAELHVIYQNMANGEETKDIMEIHIVDEHEVITPERSVEYYWSGKVKIKGQNCSECPDIVYLEVIHFQPVVQ